MAKTAMVNVSFDAVTEDDRLISVETPVVWRAELGGAGVEKTPSPAIRKGSATTLGDSGTFLRLLDLQHPLYVGRTYPVRLRLRFARAGAGRCRPERPLQTLPPS
jgi:copper(I)-binding protein